MLSHGAVVAREYGLPCVVNVTGACDEFETGQFATIDGAAGTLTLVEKQEI
jgi:pyruvate,water dikinase